MALGNSSGPVRKPKKDPEKLSPPTFSPTTGGLATSLTVSKPTTTTEGNAITSTTSNPVVVYYTTNGTEPTTSTTTKFTNTNGQLSILTIYNSISPKSDLIKIKAFATLKNYINSDIATLDFNITRVATPVINATLLEDGRYEIEITCATVNTGIYYKLYGNDVFIPVTTTTPVKKYTAKFILSDNIALCNNTNLTYINGVAQVNIKALATSSTSTTNILNSLMATRLVTHKVVTPGYAFANIDGPVVAFGCATPNAVIYYTIDGSTPTENSAAYEGGWIRDWIDNGGVNKDYKPFTVKLKAFLCGWEPSDIDEFTITPTIPKVPTPIIKPNRKNILKTEQICITDSLGSPDLNGIYYTKNGSTPTTSSTKYTACFSADGNGTTFTVKAFAVGNPPIPWIDSDVAIQEYLICASKLAAPSITPSSGPFDYTNRIGTTISMSCTTSKSAIIRYTLDGSDPDENSTIYVANTLKLNADTTIKAYATLTNYADSDITTLNFTVFRLPVDTPTFSPSNTNIKQTDKISLACTTTGATIYYSIDGGDWIRYATAFSITKSCTIAAYAVKAEYIDSDIATISYDVAAPFPGDSCTSLRPNDGADGQATVAVAGNWIVPDGVKKIVVWVCGGGGASGPSSDFVAAPTNGSGARAYMTLSQWDNNTPWYGGGGGGGSSYGVLNVTAGQSISYNTGAAGGLGGSNGNGTSATFGALNGAGGVSGKLKTAGSGGSASGGSTNNSGTAGSTGPSSTIPGGVSGASKLNGSSSTFFKYLQGQYSGTITTTCMPDIGIGIHIVG